MKFLVFCDDLRFSLLRGHVGSSRVRRFAVGSTFTTYWIGSQEVVHMISSHGLGPKPVLFLSSPDGALFFAPLFSFLPFLRSIESDAPHPSSPSLHHSLLAPLAPILSSSKVDASFHLSISDLAMRLVSSLSIGLALGFCSQIGFFGVKSLLGKISPPSGSFLV